MKGPGKATGKVGPGAGALSLAVPVDASEFSPADLASLDGILRDLKGAQDKIAAAARKWVALDAGLRRRVIEATPPSVRDIWDRLDRVGSGSLHPLLATAQGLAARYLGRLPLQEQEHYLRERIPVAIVANGALDVLAVDVQAMSSAQRMQVFAAAGGSLKVRDVAEQRAWLAAKERDAAEKAARDLAREVGSAVIERKGRWTVRGGRAYVDAAKVEHGLTQRDAVELLRDLQK